MIKALLAAILCLLPLSVQAAAADPATPKAYLIAEISVHDAATYEGYKAAVAPLVAEFGGQYLVRGGNAQALEGDKPNGRVVILEFPTLAKAQAFLQSDAYRPVADVRHKSAKSRIIIVEGVIP